MTKKLYQDNSYLFEFESEVAEVTRDKGGFRIGLRETAFYPESGGQLYDFGTLDGFEVINVQKTEDEEVVHFCREWKAEVGEKVSGKIDAPRRLENMRKHTGQHILSGAFLRHAGAATVSAHLGEVESTIEIETDKLTEEQVRIAELEANRVVMQNVPVEIGYYNREQLQEMKVRKIPDREGIFRIVKIGEHDQTACGGTHCRSTGEVGMIKIIASENIRGHQRFTFLTGEAALADYALRGDVTSRLSVTLTCHVRDLSNSIEGLLEENKRLRFEVGRLNKELMPVEAEKLIKKAVTAERFRIIHGSYPDSDMQTLKNLALYLTEADGNFIILSERDKIIIAVSPDIPIKAGEAAKLFCEKFGGKGGGNPAIAQVGRIPSDKLNEYIEGFIEIIRDEIVRR